MIATGNHCDFDSLRVAPPFTQGRLSQKAVPFLVGAAVPGCPAVEGYRYDEARANTLPCTRAVREACPYERRWVCTLALGAFLS